MNTWIIFWCLFIWALTLPNWVPVGHPVFFSRFGIYLENLSISSTFSERGIWSCLRERQLSFRHAGPKMFAGSTREKKSRRNGHFAVSGIPPMKDERSCTNGGVGVMGQAWIGVGQESGRFQRVGIIARSRKDGTTATVRPYDAYIIQTGTFNRFTTKWHDDSQLNVFRWLSCD